MEMGSSRRRGIAKSAVDDREPDTFAVHWPKVASEANPAGRIGRRRAERAERLREVSITIATTRGRGALCDRAQQEREDPGDGNKVAIPERRKMAAKLKTDVQAGCGRPTVQGAVMKRNTSTGALEVERQVRWIRGRLSTRRGAQRPGGGSFERTETKRRKRTTRGPIWSRTFDLYEGERLSGGSRRHDVCHTERRSIRRRATRDPWRIRHLVLGAERGRRLSGRSSRQRTNRSGTMIRGQRARDDRGRTKRSDRKPRENRFRSVIAGLRERAGPHTPASRV